MDGLPARRRAQERKRQEQGYDQDSWKSFDMDTEAGRLLSKLYAGQNKPKINYPAVKTKARRQEVQRPFIPAGVRVGQRDPRSTVRSFEKEAMLDIPQVGLPKQKKYHPIDFIETKKGKQSIQKQISAISQRMEEYRPMPGVDRDIITKKLQYSSTFGGGKALPQEFLPCPNGMVRTHKNKDQGIAADAAKNEVLKQKSDNVRDNLENLFDDIVAEISDRKEHLAFLRKMGGLDQAEKAKITGEISLRTAELQKIQMMLEAETADGL